MSQQDSDKKTGLYNPETCVIIFNDEPRDFGKLCKGFDLGLLNDDFTLSPQGEELIATPTPEHR